MSLFDIFKKKPVYSWEQSLEALNNDTISLQEFINRNASHPLYYSTPVGENREGKPTVWLLCSDKSDMPFYPTFLSKDLCYQSLTSAGRKDFLIIQGTLESALSSLDTSPLLKEVGLLIQGSDGQLAIPPNMRVQK